MRYSLIIFLSIFMLSLVNANGLSLSSNTFQVNKTMGTDYFIQLTITNQESFTFYNITSDNSVIQFDKFNLNSGENKTFQAKINSNSNFNGEIKIKGYYYADLGSSSKIENIKIDSNGLDICNLDLIQGDSINWTNKLQGEVKLKNLNTNQYITTINSQSSFLNLFDTPVEFDYQVFKIGLPFSQICHLNIRPTSGYIHSSTYDSIINLNLKITYEPTTISVYFPKDNYTMSYNEEKEDIFTITNTGNKLGKTIKLSGDWFTFDKNNFDLNAGQSINIGYKIKPVIFETNQTDKTHIKDIKIEGNFNTLEKPINVFIKYKDLSGIYGNNSYDLETLKNMVNFFCSVYPDECPKTIVYGNESNKNVTFTINEETYKENVLSQDKFQEEVRNILKTYANSISILSSTVNNISENSLESKQNIESSNSKLDNFLNTLTFILLIICGVIISIFLIVLIFDERLRNKVVKNLGFTKREEMI